MMYVISQVFGWLATFFRAGGMLAKKSSTIKILVSIGNAGWLISGVLTGNAPLIASNGICLVVMIFDYIREKRNANK